MMTIKAFPDLSGAAPRDCAWYAIDEGSYDPPDCDSTARHQMGHERLEQVDVYRIKDFVVERPFGQRLLGTGNILLLTMDPTTSQVRLENLKTDVVNLYEKLRSAAESERVRRGVRILDNE